MAPASPVPRTPGAPPPPAAAAPALPAGGPRRPSLRPAAAPAVPLPARPQHVELPNPAEPPTVGIRELARAILESVGQVRGHFSSCPSKKGQPEVLHFAEEPSWPLSTLLGYAFSPRCSQSFVDAGIPTGMPLNPSTPQPGWEQALLDALDSLHTC
eukprot:EG_transcript_34096